MHACTKAVIFPIHITGVCWTLEVIKIYLAKGLLDIMLIGTLNRYSKKSHFTCILFSLYFRLLNAADMNESIDLF